MAKHSPKNLVPSCSLFSSQIHLKSCSYVVSVVWISPIEGCQRFSYGFGLDSGDGRRQAAEGWRVETSFHFHSEGSSSSLVIPQIGEGQKLLLCPSVWVFFWKLPP
ncbi:hypothetical protein V6N13_112166 [Hibiscus sabdariffa]|uniref:Uncharacterized protein n=1 Tax=Hibiscus sabdariffa TaxID=183260 RepID=A0ABR2TMD1_9ROSI